MYQVINLVELSLIRSNHKKEATTLVSSNRIL